MTAQGVDVNVFDGLSMSHMVSVHAAAALSAAEMNPICGFIHRPGKTSALDEGFHEQRAIAIQPFPVVRQITGGERKDLASKAFNGKAGWNQKSTIGNNELKIPFALFGTPADPGVTGRHLPGRAGELQAGKKSTGQLFRLDEITHGRAIRDTVAEVMPSLDHLLEGRKHVSVNSLNEMKRERLELAGASGNGCLWQIVLRSKNNLPRTGGGSIAQLGKNHQSIRLKAFKESAAFFILKLAAGPFPFEEFTQGFG